MFKDKGGMQEAVGGVKQESGPDAERLMKPSDKDIEQILALGFDGLNSTQNHDTPHQRRLQSGNDAMYHKFLKSGAHGALFVDRNADGRITAYLALRADAAEGEGFVERLRTMSNESDQVEVMRKLLKTAEKYLRAAPRGCAEAQLDAPHPSERVQSALKLDNLNHFFKLKEQDKPANDNEPPAVLEKAA